MRAEDMKGWLQRAELEETQEGYVGAGDNWRLLVKLITTIWETGEIPRQMLWMIVVFIPKGTSGDFRRLQRDWAAGGTLEGDREGTGRAVFIDRTP